MPLDPQLSLHPPKDTSFHACRLRKSSVVQASPDALLHAPLEQDVIKGKKASRPRASFLTPLEFGKLPEEGFVRLPQVLSVYPISRAAWWAGVKDGSLPSGFLLSPRVRAWSSKSIRELIAETLSEPI